jgi:hypothetical protein
VLRIIGSGNRGMKIRENRSGGKGSRAMSASKTPSPLSHKSGLANHKSPRGRPLTAKSGLLQTKEDWPMKGRTAGFMCLKTVTAEEEDGLGSSLQRPHLDTGSHRPGPNRESASSGASQYFPAKPAMSLQEED